MSQGESRNLWETQALVALGSNEAMGLGGTKIIFEAAFQALEKLGVSVSQKSKLYLTPCFPQGNGPDFVNAAARIETSLTPEKLLCRLHEVEAEFGRLRTKRWGPRSLDLDLIAQGCAVLPDPETQRHWVELPLGRQIKEAPKQLILPHPRLQDRGFVLIPLAEIAPGWVHPLSGKTAMEMLDDLPEAEKEAIRALG